MFQLSGVGQADPSADIQAGILAMGDRIKNLLIILLVVAVIVLIMFFLKK